MQYTRFLLAVGISVRRRCWYSGGIAVGGHGESVLRKRIMVKIVLRERESAQEAVRRFRKIVERSGLKREMRRRERYEKPSDIKRKAKNRAIRRAQQAQPPAR